MYMVVISETLSIFLSSGWVIAGSNQNRAGTGWYGGSDDMACGLVRRCTRSDVAPLWTPVGLAESDEIPDNRGLPRPRSIDEFGD